MAKTVLITGCSSGIGQATAKHFLAEGWNVAATARSLESIENWPRSRSLLRLQLDVTDEASIARAVEATLARFEAIDVLINNAGYGLFGPVEGATAEEFEAIFRTNVFGTVAMIRHVLPSMRQSKSGTIINMSSVAGRIGTAFLAPYHATKFAVEGLSESLRFELESHGIKVKIVEPGHFKSDFLTRSLRWTSHGAYEPQFGNMKGWIEGSGAKAAETSEVAKVIFRAASDGSKRLRYQAGAGVLMALHALLPDGIWRKMVGAGMNRAPRARQSPDARTSPSA